VKTQSVRLAHPGLAPFASPAALASRPVNVLAAPSQVRPDRAPTWPVLVALLVALLFSHPLAAAPQATPATQNKHWVRIRVMVQDQQQIALEGATVTVSTSGPTIVQQATEHDGTVIIQIPILPGKVVSINAAMQGYNGASAPSITISAQQTETTVDAGTITLAAAQSSQTRNVFLTVQVMDGAGSPLSGAHVNVYVGYTGIATWGSDSVVRPNDGQGDTNPSGIVQIQISAKSGSNLGVTLEVSRDDMKTARQDVNFGTNFPDRPPLQKITLVPVTPDTQNSVPGAIGSIKLKFAVEDDDGPVGQANVAILMREKFVSKPFTATTGDDGNATVDVPVPHTAVYLSVDVEAYASKMGYTDSPHQAITLNESDIGKTFDEGILYVKKKPGFPGSLAVQVHVTDDQKNLPVPDAVVTLNRTQLYSQTTGSDGMATFSLSEEGNFDITINQQYYQAFSTSQLITSDAAPTKPLEYSLTLKDSSLPSPDTINITVLHTDDSGGDPQPLPGATVTDGQISATTDASGQAALTRNYDVTQDITVSASGYKSQVKSVRINKGMTLSAGTGSATFTLVPDNSVDSPFHVYVQVQNTRGDSIPGAGVDYYTAAGQRLYGNLVSASKGFADFDSSVLKGIAAAADLRKSGLLVNVSATGFQPIVNQFISPDLLQPSPRPATYLVVMNKDWTDLTNQIAGLEARVNAWNNDVKSVAADQTQTYVSQTDSAKQAADLAFAQIQAAQAAMKTVSPQAPSTRISQLQVDLGAKAELVLGDSGDLESQLSDAQKAVAACTTAADADVIRGKYQQAIKLIGEIGSINQSAAQDHEELLQIAQQTMANQDVITSLQPYLTEIQNQQKTAQENAANLTAYYKQKQAASDGLAGRQTSLQGELQAILDKNSPSTPGALPLPADLIQRLTVMQGILGSWNSSASSDQSLSVPYVITDAPGYIVGVEEQANQLMKLMQQQSSTVDTMGAAADEISTTFTNETFEIGLAADLLKQADDCAKKAVAAAATPAQGTPTAVTLPEDEPTIPPPSETKATAPPPGNSPPRAGSDCEPKAVEQQVEALMHQATTSTSFAEGDGYLARADGLAAPYPCIFVTLKNFEGLWSTYKRTFKTPPGPGTPSGVKVEGLPEDNPTLATTLATAVVTAPPSRPPTLETIPEDNPANVPPANNGSIPQRQPATQPTPAQTAPSPTTAAPGSRWKLVSVSASPQTNQGWTYNANSASAHLKVYNGDQSDFSWAPPPAQVTSDGFTVNITVVSEPTQKNTLSQMICVSGPQASTSNTCAQAVAQNGAAKTANQAVKFMPPPDFGSFDVKVSLAWGAVNYTYSYQPY